MSAAAAIPNDGLARSPDAGGMPLSSGPPDERAFDVICTLDGDNRFLQVSPRAGSMWGYAPEELVGRGCLDLVHPEDRAAMAAMLAQVRTGAAADGFEGRLVRKDGAAVTLLWSVMWSASHGLAFAVARDLGHRLRAEERLRRAQSLEALGQLTGGIAHDFNNLLTVILGNCEILADCLVDEPRLCRLAEVSHSAAERGADLTRRLLAFSRRQSLSSTEVDARLLVDGMSELLQRTLGEDIEVAIRAAEVPCTVRIDAAQLEASLLDLAINARDAMPDGGRLTIETAAVALDAAAAAALDLAPGDYVVLSVSDTGAGMSAEVRERAFEPFFTTKEVGKGSGLGLSMVYGFITQSRGHITVESRPGRGTTLRILLPRVALTAATVAVAQPASEARGRETILVVEDNDLVRSHVAALLRSFGYDVIEASDGPAALAMLQTRPPVDLLFSDVVMPGGLDGFELARHAVQAMPHLKVLLTTGYAEKALATGAASASYPLLRKPYRRAMLMAAIRGALDGEAAAT